MQYINKTGFRACVKELYEAKYDPLSVTYTVLSGKSSTATKLINFSTYNSLNNKKRGIQAIHKRNAQKLEEIMKTAFGWWWKTTFIPFSKYVFRCIMVCFIILAVIFVLCIAYILSWTKSFCFSISFFNRKKTQK